MTLPPSARYWKTTMTAIPGSASSSTARSRARRFHHGSGRRVDGDPPLSPPPSELPSELPRALPSEAARRLAADSLTAVIRRPLARHSWSALWSVLWAALSAALWKAQRPRADAGAQAWWCSSVIGQAARGVVPGVDDLPDRVRRLLVVARCAGCRVLSAPRRGRRHETWYIVVPRLLRCRVIDHRSRVRLGGDRSLRKGPSSGDASVGASGEPAEVVGTATDGACQNAGVPQGAGADKRR